MTVSHQKCCCFQREILSDVVPRFRYVVCNIRCCPTLYRNPPMLSTTSHIAGCCTAIRPSCLQRGSLPDVIAAFGQLVGNIGIFSGHRKSPGRFALQGPPSEFSFFAILMISQTLWEKKGKKGKSFKNIIFRFLLYRSVSACF